MAKTSLLVARNPMHARNSAVIDWGWVQTGQTVFKKPDGERVVYVSDGLLVGHEPGTKVYLGWEWYKRSDAREIELLEAQGRFEFVRPERVDE